MQYLNLYVLNDKLWVHVVQVNMVQINMLTVY
jgi:hypothetical protein